MGAQAPDQHDGGRIVAEGVLIRLNHRARLLLRAARKGQVVIEALLLRLDEIAVLPLLRRQRA
ncbi:hypothetical protein ABD440_16550, partial [Chromobacterium piscinae]|uniref:hypothetical protein n=1 Tax=Chromobacterium piscinae TaxID=686831 RepID=UPI0031FBE00A